MRAMRQRLRQELRGEDGRTLVFDSFECAIQALAPVCPHCGCRIIGHGVQRGDTIFCCVHCAKYEGVKGLRDRD
jgi:nitrite reductase/ring-hydroxylating ferredoxin subunit